MEGVGISHDLGQSLVQCTTSVSWKWRTIHLHHLTYIIVSFTGGDGPSCLCTLFRPRGEAPPWFSKGGGGAKIFKGGGKHFFVTGPQR